MDIHCKLVHDCLHAHKLLILKRQKRLVLVERLQRAAVGIKGLIVVVAECLSNGCGSARTQSTVDKGQWGTWGREVRTCEVDRHYSSDYHVCMQVEEI